MAGGAFYPMNPAVPDHGPAALVSGFDIYSSSGSSDDFFANLADLKAAASPAFWAGRNGGHRVVTDAQMARNAVKEADVVVPLTLGLLPEGFMSINLDPPAINCRGAFIFLRETVRRMRAARLRSGVQAVRHTL